MTTTSPPTLAQPPDLPPLPPFPAHEDTGTLQRWGVTWPKTSELLHQRMPDGYWTPWHLADSTISTLHSQIDGLMKRLAAAERERDGNYLPASLSVRLMNALRQADQMQLLNEYKAWRLEGLDAMASQGGGDG